MTKNLDKAIVITQLNKVLRFGLAGVVRCGHYSFMIFGYNRIPVIGWMQVQAAESLAQAKEVGELVTHLDSQPLLATHQHDIADILGESLVHEHKAFCAYQELLELVKDRSVLFEEYARRLIAEEEMHQGEADKMLLKPEDIETFSVS